MSNQLSTLRSYWTFQYKAQEIGDAAARQRDYRKEREQFWRNKKEEVMATIRKEGVEINESIADQLMGGGVAAAAAMGKNAYSTQALRGPSVTIREDLVQNLQECVTKIETHRKAAIDYEGWVQFLTAPANREKTLELTQQDWLY